MNTSPHVRPAFSIGGFRAKAVAGFDDSPDNYASLDLWWDVSSLSGFANNDPIGGTGDEMVDISGNSNHGIEITASDNPLYKTNIFGSRPAALFDGILDGWNFTSDIVLSGAYTVIAIVDIASDDHMLVSNQTVNRQFRRGRSGANDMSWYDGSAETISSTTGMPTITDAQMLTWRRDGSNNLSFRANKTGIAISSGPTSSTASITANRFGRPLGTNSWSVFNGHLAELVIYTAHRSDAEVDALYDDYFDPKWLNP